MTRTLSAESITVSHAGLADFSITINPGEVVGLAGPSGAGKTTLARVLGGVIQPESGRVLLGGQPLPRRCREIALVSQDPRAACNPRWNLRRIIAEPLRIAGEQTDVDGFAERAHLPAELLDRRPHEVSDGQLQRACIARALAQRASFLLCDEPTSALDPALKETVMGLLAQVAGSGVGVLLISHELELLKRTADRVITL